MLKNSTKEVLAYVSLVLAGGIVVYAIKEGADLMALAALLPPILMIAWKQLQRSKAKRKRDYDTITDAQKCDVPHQEVLASDDGSLDGNASVHLEKDL